MALGLPDEVNVRSKELGSGNTVDLGVHRNLKRNPIPKSNYLALDSTVQNDYKNLRGT